MISSAGAELPTIVAQGMSPTPLPASSLACESCENSLPLASSRPTPASGSSNHSALRARRPVSAGAGACNTGHNQRRRSHHSASEASTTADSSSGSG